MSDRRVARPEVDRGLPNLDPRGAGQAVLQFDSFPERLQGGVVGSAFNLCPVGFAHRVRRMRDPLRHCAIVSQNNQSLTVAIEPPGHAKAGVVDVHAERGPAVPVPELGQHTVGFVEKHNAHREDANRGVERVPEGSVLRRRAGRAGKLRRFNGPPETLMQIAPATLSTFAEEIFLAAGADAPRARETAEHLVLANLKGHDSHGVGMIPAYVNNIMAGTCKPNADAEVIRDKGSVLLVDGKFGFGQVVGMQATQFGIDRAKENGLCCVGARNNHHLGRIGTYAERCAAEGMISVHFVNVVGHDPYVSPWGGRDRRLQTNPFCVAVPTTGNPIVLDMATSAIAMGKVRVAALKGVDVPEGSLFDEEGVATNDSSSLMRGGSLGPFGKHKGYGLAFICEVLGGGLAGEWTMQPEHERVGTIVNHMLMFILDPEVFGGIDTFRHEVDALSAYMHDTTPAKGFDKVRLPGEPERESQAAREADGIPIDDASWAEICKAAERAGLNQTDIDQVSG